MFAIKRHIPNFITCLNLFCGCMAVVFALKGWLGFAVAMVMVAAVFDFCDGLAARLLQAYSLIGKELDSLADLVSFGLAPASMLHYEFCRILSPKISYGLDTIPWELLSFFPFVIVVAAAIRLARFNIDGHQSEQFKGLPTPAAALFVGALLVFVTRTPKLLPILNSYYAIPAFTVLVSWLMLSGVPMFSLKIKVFQWRGNQLRFLLLGLGLIFTVLALILGLPWSLTVLLILGSYIVISFFISPSN